MFEISVLKEMKLSELQEIAKLAKTIKVTGAKKDTLIAQILEHQNKSVEEEKKETPKTAVEKPAENKSKRTRIVPAKSKENNQSDLFAAETPEPAKVEVAEEEKQPVQNKNPKFKKPFEKKNKNAAFQINVPKTLAAGKTLDQPRQSAKRGFCRTLPLYGMQRFAPTRILTIRAETQHGRPEPT